MTEREDEAGLILAQMLDQPIPDDEIWLNMFNSISTHPGCPNVSTAAAWADGGLREFHKRFRNSEQCFAPGLH